MKISGKRVLITGASRGLGRTWLSLLLTRARGSGCRNSQGRRSGEAKIRRGHQSGKHRPGSAGCPLCADVDAIAQMGTFDILINNAGVAGFGNPITMDFETFREELEVNYVGTLRMVRAVAPSMMSRTMA